jgi:hypothetical protein
MESASVDADRERGCAASSSSPLLSRVYEDLAVPHDGLTHELLAACALSAVAIFKFKWAVAQFKNSDVALAPQLQSSYLCATIEHARGI